MELSWVMIEEVDFKFFALIVSINWLHLSYGKTFAVLLHTALSRQHSANPLINQSIIKIRYQTIKESGEIRRLLEHKIHTIGAPFLATNVLTF